MDNMKNLVTLEQVPVLYVRGTNYEVGLAIGKTFKSLIQDFWSDWSFFEATVLPKYQSPEGKQLYADVLLHCQQKFPQYVKELEGLALGSEVSFEKIFLLHIDSFMSATADDLASQKIQADTGCTSVLCNNSEIIMAQNEDAWPENLNRCYVVVAEIIDTQGNVIEKFGALTHSGYLPGYSMGFNFHGLVETVNTLVPKFRYPKGTPRWFLTRAVLGTRNREDVLQILADVGSGIADGFSINICQMNFDDSEAEMYNVEVAPPLLQNSSHETLKSLISVKDVGKGESYVHCNKYLHLEVPFVSEVLTSSIRRHAAISKLPSPTTMELVQKTVSDQSDPEYPVHRSDQIGGRDGAKTVATGIFHMTERKWYIYTKPPATSKPTAVLTMDI